MTEYTSTASIFQGMFVPSWTIKVVSRIAIEPSNSSDAQFLIERLKLMRVATVRPIHLTCLVMK